MILLFVVTALFGLFLGSFLFNAADRMIRDESFVKGRSKCEECKYELGPLNLIPVVSFLVQKGKCTNCQSKISFYYPFAEILTAIFLVSALYLSNLYRSPTLFTLWHFTFYIIIFSLLLVIFFTDLRYQLIPNIVLYAALVFAVLFKIGYKVLFLYKQYEALSGSDLGRYLARGDYFKNFILWDLRALGMDFLGAIIIVLFFSLLVALTRGRGMGTGDIWLGGIIGILCGFPYGFIAVFLGFIIGSLASLVLMAARRKNLKQTVPFGPFLILGCLLTLLYGNQIFTWYITLR